MKRNKKGFTIVELVIVIGVIGILSAILIPTFVSLTSKAEGAAAKAECASAYTAYSAIAFDGKVDAEEAEEMGIDPATAKEGILFKKQNEVAIKRGNDFYAWSEENKEWASYTPSPALEDEDLVLPNFVAYSTFNGCVVYVK